MMVLSRKVVVVADIIKFNHLVKSYGSKKAVDDISFAIQKGEIFGFLGPNGAGKTTTIRCLMDFVRPDGGSVKIGGLKAQADSVAVKRKIGYLPADYYHYDKWSGQEHIDFACRLRGCAPDTELIAKLQFDARTKVKYLSTGNQQKLGIVLALLGKPDILVLDEPTRGLDPVLQNQVYDILRDFRRDGGTVFMSSHNLSEVQKICDTVAVIKAGRLVVNETLEGLRGKNLHHVEATLRRPIKPDLFKGEGVEIVSHAAHSLVLRVRGDLNPVLKQLITSGVKDLEVTHASLEELFLELYQ